MILPNTTVDLVLEAGQRDHVQGLLTAPIVLVEYGDYQCPYCAQAADMVRSLQHQLGDRLCYVFRHFPLTKLHLHAMRAAEAAEAAGMQHQFWQMHHHLFEYQSALSDLNLLHYASNLELDLDRFEHDFNRKHHHQIHDDLKTGKESGVDSTPTFFINGVYYADNWDLTTMLNTIEHRYPPSK